MQFPPRPSDLWTRVFEKAVDVEGVDTLLVAGTEQRYRLKEADAMARTDIGVEGPLQQSVENWWAEIRDGVECVFVQKNIVDPQGFENETEQIVDGRL